MGLVIAMPLSGALLGAFVEDEFGPLCLQLTTPKNEASRGTCLVDFALLWASLRCSHCGVGFADVVVPSPVSLAKVALAKVTATRGKAMHQSSHPTAQRS